MAVAIGDAPILQGTAGPGRLQGQVLQQALGGEDGGIPRVLGVGGIQDVIVVDIAIDEGKLLGDRRIARLQLDVLILDAQPGAADVRDGQTPVDAGYAQVR